MITNNDDDSGSVICLDQAVLICFLHYVWVYVYDDATDDNDDEMNEEGTLPPEHVFHLPPCISPYTKHNNTMKTERTTNL